MNQGTTVEGSANKLQDETSSSGKKSLQALKCLDAVSERHPDSDQR
jgi:hypothetical protein